MSVHTAPRRVGALRLRDRRHRSASALALNERRGGRSGPAEREHDEDQHSDDRERAMAARCAACAALSRRIGSLVGGKAVEPLRMADAGRTVERIGEGRHMRRVRRDRTRVKLMRSSAYRSVG